MKNLIGHTFLILFALSLNPTHILGASDCADKLQCIQENGGAWKANKWLGKDAALSELANMGQDKTPSSNDSNRGMSDNSDNSSEGEQAQDESGDDELVTVCEKKKQEEEEAGEGESADAGSSDSGEATASNDSGDSEGGGEEGSTEGDNIAASGGQGGGKNCGDQGGQAHATNESAGQAQESASEANQAMNQVSNPLDMNQRDGVQQALESLGQDVQALDEAATASGLTSKDREALGNILAGQISDAGEVDTSITPNFQASSDSGFETEIPTTLQGAPTYSPSPLEYANTEFNSPVESIPREDIDAGNRLLAQAALGSGEEGTRKETESESTLQSGSELQSSSPIDSNSLYNGGNSASIHNNIGGAIITASASALSQADNLNQNDVKTNVKNKNRVRSVSEGSSTRSRSRRGLASAKRANKKARYKRNKNLNVLKALGYSGPRRSIATKKKRKRNLRTANNSRNLAQPDSTSLALANFMRTLGEDSEWSVGKNTLVVPVLWKWMVPLILLMFIVLWSQKQRTLKRVLAARGTRSQNTQFSGFENKPSGPSVPSSTSAAGLQKQFLPKRNYFMFDLDINKWVLVRTDQNGHISAPLGEVLKGTITSGASIGASDEQKMFQLDENGEWKETLEKQQYLIHFYNAH